MKSMSTTMSTSEDKPGSIAQQDTSEDISLLYIVKQPQVVVHHMQPAEGIGYETAKSIALMGGRVILAVRTEERGESAIAKMKAEFQEAKAEQRLGIVDKPELDVQYRVCDLGSLKSTMEFINWFKSTGLTINILICNACTYSLKELQTEDGWEVTYQINYLAHFLMVAHFLPIMCHSGDDCRIVIISSNIHQQATFDVDYASTSKMKKYDGFDCYTSCKMFQIMHMYSLDRVLEKHPTVDVLCVHRGKLDALAFPNNTQSEEGCSCHFACLKCCGRFTDDADGAETALYAALDPNLKGLSRGYFLRPRDKPRWPSKEARNRQFQDLLWKSSIDNLHDMLPEDILKILNES